MESPESQISVSIPAVGVIQHVPPESPVSRVVTLACHANRDSINSKVEICSAADFNRFIAVSNTVVSKATPPIQSTTPNM